MEIMGARFLTEQGPVYLCWSEELGINPAMMSGNKFPVQSWSMGYRWNPKPATIQDLQEEFLWELRRWARRNGDSRSNPHRVVWDENLKVRFVPL